MENLTKTESLESFELLKNILGEDNITLSDNNEVLFNQMKLMDDNGFKLLLFNEDSKKFRRKNKNDYKYLNFYLDCSKLVDFFLSQHEEFENVTIKTTDEEDKKGLIILSLKNITNNKIEYEKQYYNENCEVGNIRPSDYFITKFIREYINEHHN